MVQSRMLSTAILLVLLALPASAGDLKLEFRDGRVTLLARDVSVRQILTEWAKVGGTQIVNLERLSAVPVTLQLEAVSEQKALEVVLRSVAGYVAAPRRPEHPGRSAYDRILVLAISNPPAASPRSAGSPPAFPAPREVGAPTPTPAPLFPTPIEDSDVDVDNDAPLGAARPGMPVNSTTPGTVPQMPRSAPTALGGTSVPGVVVPVPQPPNQPQTAQPPNPGR